MKNNLSTPISAESGHNGQPAKEPTSSGSERRPCSPSLEDALLCVQKIEGVHEDDQFTEERHMVTLAVEIERLERDVRLCKNWITAARDRLQEMPTDEETVELINTCPWWDSPENETSPSAPD